MISKISVKNNLMTIKLNFLDIFFTNIVLHQLRMIYKPLIQVTLIYCYFSTAEMITAEIFLPDNP